MAETSHNRTLGAHLRAAREAAGLSTRQLAVSVGVNHSYLVKLETDQKTNPSAQVLMELAEALSIEPTELLAYIGVKPSAVLPTPKIYFRQRYGMNARDAATVEQLIKDYQRKQQGGGDTP